MSGPIPLFSFIHLDYGYIKLENYIRINRSKFVLIITTDSGQDLNSGCLDFQTFELDWVNCAYRIFLRY